MPWSDRLSRREALAQASRLAHSNISANQKLLSDLAEIIGASRDVASDWLLARPPDHIPQRFDFSQLIDRNGRFVLATKPEVNWDLVTKDLQLAGCEIHDVKLDSDHTSGIVNTADLLSVVEVSELDGKVWSGGKGLTRGLALQNALAEATERLLAHSPLPQTAFVAAAADLKRMGILVPDWNVGIRDAYSDVTNIDWIAAHSLRGERAALPAERTYYNYEPRSGVLAFALQHTAGLAAGATLEEAIWAGLTECLERDAYWIVMRCRMCCPTIEPALIRQNNPQLLDRIAQAGLRLVLKDISLDWPLRIVHATLVDESKRIPAFSHGTGSHTTYETAAFKAVLECLQLRTGLVRHCQRHSYDVQFPERRAKDPRSAWCDPASAEMLSHLYEDLSGTPSCNVGVDMIPAEVIGKLQERTGSILWAEVGRTHHLRVVRVWIPGCVIPDHTPDTVSDRLRSWLARTKIPYPYSIPILT